MVSYDIPKLSNVRVIYRDNVGYDFGGHRASLDAIDKEMFDYFFFLNSGVIGPVLKDRNREWYSDFTNKITKKVKLVGTTIVCLPPWDRGGFGPKVEGFFFLLDRVGLNLVLQDGKIFFDHKTKVDAILNGEYALSKCIMNHGYTLDCRLRKYQHIDWYDRQNYYLNENKHPSRVMSYFGQSINPFEVIFHKWFWHDEPYVSLDVIENYTKLKFLASKDGSLFPARHSRAARLALRPSLSQAPLRTKRRLRLNLDLERRPRWA